MGTSAERTATDPLSTGVGAAEAGGPDWKARPDGADYDTVRGRLVDAAEQIIRDNGVGALRLDAVAEQVGLHRSSVYRYVNSKEELITAVVVQATLRIGREIIDEIGEKAPPEQLLVEGITAAMARMAEDPVHRSLMDPSASEAMSRIAGTALTEGIRPLIEPMFDRPESRRAIRDDVSADDITRWLQIVSSGLIRSPNIVPDPEELRRLLDLMLVPSLIAPESR